MLVSIDYARTCHTHLHKLYVVVGDLFIWNPSPRPTASVPKAHSNCTTHLAHPSLKDSAAARRNGCACQRTHRIGTVSI